MNKTLAVMLGALLLAGCADMDVPDLNNPSIELLQKQPPRSAINAAATGLLIGHRVDVASANGYVAMLGLLGREAYNFDAADPRFIQEMLVAPSLDPGSPRFGGNFWQQPYANIRNANILLSALDAATSMSDAEKEATRGFAKTIQALDFLVLINTRDTNGAAIDVGGALGGPLGEIKPKDEVLAHIAGLLDQAKGHLAQGGAAFPFPLSSGFRGIDPIRFNTPATFLKFNRAVKARVDVYRMDWAQALVDLSESFLDPAGPLDLGVYHVFSANSGDVLNGLVSPNLFVHPSVINEAETVGPRIDERVTRKTVAVAPRTVQGLTSGHQFRLYPTNTSPVPIIRNEELILLRAEALIHTGQVPEAADLLNLIRTRSGGLPGRGDLTANNILDELLRQRRYSLLFEGGHRWIDLRRYGRLGTLAQEGQTVHPRFPIPVAETDARQ
ncbi:MAG TPA: RagB/SusD family nutrient uptake outer membrane protein [Myxococcaceae bacterium]|nr:RagB/SusD family nutrient uptake outer membrane protein [Myxococcaceae bacterium]